MCPIKRSFQLKKMMLLREHRFQEALKFTLKRERGRDRSIKGRIRGAVKVTLQVLIDEQKQTQYLRESGMGMS